MREEHLRPRPPQHERALDRAADEDEERGLERILGVVASPMNVAKLDFDVTAVCQDFRVGGHGMNEGSFHGGPPHRFRSTYTDIVEHQRIVYTYDMWIDDVHISTSITTIVLEPTDGGTRLTLTEQGVHFDGRDSGEQREIGTAGLLDALGATLEA